MAGWLALPEGLELWVLILLLATSFAASFITAAFGIGGGGLLLAVMAALIPTAALIPVHGVVQLGSNAGRMLLLLGRVFWPALTWFAVGSVAGCMLGGLVVVELPAEIVQIGVGCFVIWTVFARPPRWLRSWPLVTGAVSSFLTMFFGATGLFVASYTKSHELSRHSHVATHAALMTMQHGLKVVVFGLLGFVFAEWAGVIVAMILVGGFGTVAGRSVLNRIDDRRFRLALDILLVLISLRLLWAGAEGLLSAAP
jgi:uncharacterized membrane protein YfcA